MTIHRSQGKTLNKVFVNLDAGTFAPEQGYVAISRAKNLDGLYLKGKVYDIDFFADEAVIRFMTYCKKNGYLA